MFSTFLLLWQNMQSAWSKVFLVLELEGSSLLLPRFLLPAANAMSSSYFERGPDYLCGK